jgi:DNA topoisomerase-1
MNHAADTTVDLAADLAANQIGLRWVCDNMPGIRRTSTRAGFSYVGPRGKRLRSPTDLQRIKSLAIPPAYQDAWICPLPNDHLQATGRDARGRKQYRYHPDWLARRSETKFASLARFGRGLPLLRKRVHQELSSGETPTRTRVLAAIVHLLDTAWLRIGNESYQQQNGSYGLTTLRNRHSQIEGSVLKLNFVGRIQLVDATSWLNRSAGVS